MRTLKANVLKRDNVLLSGGGLSFAPVCFFVFFLSQTADAGVLAGAGILAVALSFLLLPLLYDRIQNTVAVSVGRYHLPLAVSTLCGAGFTVIATSARVWFPATVSIIFTLAFVPMAVVSFLTFYSAAGSIRARLIGIRDTRHAVFVGLFTALGAVVVALAYYLARMLGSSASYVAAGQVAGIAFLVGGALVYFSSVSYMPRFIRLEEPTVRSLKEKYRTFFAPFSKKKMAANAIGHFFQTAAVACTTCLFATISVADGWEGLAVFGAFLAGFGLCAAIGAKAVFQKNVTALSVVAAIFSIVSAAGILTCFLFIDGGDMTRLLAGGCIALAGAGGGLQRAVVLYRTQEAILSNETTAGIFGNFYNMLTVCAFAVSLLTALGGTYAMLYAVIALGFCGAVCAILGRSHVQSLAMPELDVQITEEIMRNISAD